MNVGFYGFYGSFTVYPLCAFFCCRRCCWPWVFLLGFFASLFCYKTILQNNNFLYRSNPIFSQLPGDHNCGSNAILTTLYEVEWPIIDINIVKKHNTTTHATPFQLLWFISTCSSLLIGCSIPLSNLFLFFSALRIFSALLHSRDQPITVSISGLEALSTSLAPWKMFWSAPCSTLWFPKEISRYM